VAPSGMQVNRSTAGADTVVQVTKPNGGTVEFIVLTPEQSQQAWRTSFGGQERLVLSNATVLTDGTMVRLQAQTPSDFALSIFPPVPSVTTQIKTYTGTPDGPFTHYVLDPPSQPVPLDFTVTQTQPADPALPALSGTLESTWDKAAVYKLDIPAAAANRHVIMDIHYVGDAARLYIGGQLFDDNFYNGDPFSIPLWRIPKTEWPMLSLKVIPWSDALASRMPKQAKSAVAMANDVSAMDKVTVTTSDQMELPISP